MSRSLSELTSSTDGVTSMTEYRIVARYKNATLNTRTMKKKSFAKAVEDLAKLHAQIDAGKLASYWDGADIHIEAREVSEWTPIS